MITPSPSGHAGILRITATDTIIRRKGYPVDYIEFGPEPRGIAIMAVDGLTKAHSMVFLATADAREFALAILAMTNGSGSA
jgi:hypothetical protein